MAKLSDLLRQQTAMNLPNDAPLQATTPTAPKVTPTVVAPAPIAQKPLSGGKIAFDSLEYFNNVVSEKNNKFVTKPVYIREDYAALLSKLSSMSGLSMKVILDNILEPILSKGGEFSISEHIVSMMKNDIKNQF